MNRIAIINTCIAGSTGKIATGLHNYIQSKGETVFFCYGREDGLIREKYYKIGTKWSFYFHVGLTRLFGLQGFGSFFATKRLLSFLQKQKINVVYIVSPHGYYLNEKALLSFLASNNIKVIYLMIDEYAFSGKCPYCNGCNNLNSGCGRCPQKKEYPQSYFLDGSRTIFRMKKRVYPKIKDLTFVGPEYVVKMAKKSPLMKDKKFFVLDEAIDTSFYSPRNPDNLLADLRINKSKRILLNVAPYSSSRKGCRFYFDLARSFQGDDRYVFIYIGLDIDAQGIQIPTNMISFGYIEDQDRLAQFYSLADLFVFPSLQDTMPNACLEALSSGTPLLCFDVSGMPYIADDTVATFVEVGNVEKMISVVKNLNKKTNETVSKCRNYALSRYDNQQYYSKLLDLVKKE